MCVAVADPIYQPAMRLISSITQANPTLVTTTFAHDYFTGDIVRLIIPRGFGMLQADNLLGIVTVINTTQFNLDIDTSSFDAYVVPPSEPLSQQCGQVIPVGEINANLNGATKNTLPSRIR